MADFPNQVMQNAARNLPYTVEDAVYPTQLPPQQEGQFRRWLEANKNQGPLKYYNPDDSFSDYDMRGYWKDTQGKISGNSGIDPHDGQMHFPDTYKTPYHETFSRESRYATKDAPYWDAKDRLIDKTGTVLFDPSKRKK
jgi:hypothetical protein